MAMKNIDDTVKVGRRLYSALFSEAMTSLSMILIPVTEFLKPELRDVFIALTVFFALRSGVTKLLDDRDNRRIKSDLSEKISSDTARIKEIESNENIRLEELNIESKRIKLRGDVFELKKDIVKQQERFRGEILITRLKNIEKRNEFSIKLALADSDISKTVDALEQFSFLDDEVDFLQTDGLSAPFEQVSIDKKIGWLGIWVVYYPLFNLIDEKLAADIDAL